MSKLNWKRNSNQSYGSPKFHKDVKPHLDGKSPGPSVQRMRSRGESEKDPARVQLRANQARDAETSAKKRSKPSMPRMPWDDKT